MSTKKMLRLIIIMAVLVVVSIVGYLVVDNNKRKEEQAQIEEEQSLQLFNFNSDLATEVIFDSKEAYFKCENKDGTWTLTDTDYPFNLELNHYYINVVCATMSSLLAEEKIGVDSSRLEEYGLDDPSSITCYAGGIEYKLLLGNTSATGEYRYVMLPEDENTVFCVDATTASALEGESQYLRIHDIIPYQENDIIGYRIDRKNDSVSLEMQDGLWHMSEPLPDANVNSATVNSMLTTITRFEVDGFLTADPDADLSQYGLDQPDVTLTIQTADETTVLQFADQGNGLYNMLNENTDVVSTVTNSGFLETKATELLMDTVISLSFYDASALEVTSEDISFTMEMDHEAGQYLFNGEDVAPLGEDAVTAFTNLFQSAAQIPFTDMDADAKIPEDAEPVYTFRFTMNDGTDTTLTLVQKDADNYYAVADGKYTGLYISSDVMSETLGLYQTYEALTDIVNDA